jgi:uncharacterized protein (TIGR00290 family)
MHACRKAVLLWSGGKDSALALYHVGKSHPGLHIVKLVTCVSQAYDRVSMHGVRRQLVKDQAEALGLRVDFVVIPPSDDPTCPMLHALPGTNFPPNDVYTRAMLAAFEQCKDEGVEVVVFGDIFLEDLRAFRDRLLARADLVGCYPLWERDSDQLYNEFHSLRFKAITVCVDRERLTEEHCGQFLTPAFRASLPEGVDPCGERGEYHSFTFDGPTFRRPVPFRVGDLHRQPPFVFRELYPADLPLPSAGSLS